MVMLLGLRRGSGGGSHSSGHNPMHMMASNRNGFFYDFNVVLLSHWGMSLGMTLYKVVQVRVKINKHLIVSLMRICHIARFMKDFAWMILPEREISFFCRKLLLCEASFQRAICDKHTSTMIFLFLVCDLKVLLIVFDIWISTCDQTCFLSFESNMFIYQQFVASDTTSLNLGLVFLLVFGACVSA